jgi:hypothetical protein
VRIGKTPPGEESGKCWSKRKFQRQLLSLLNGKPQQLSKDEMKPKVPELPEEL